jgi:hypothetical protein
VSIVTESENWRIVDGFDGYYEISNFGRVRSLARRDPVGRARTGIVLRANLTSRGYLKVTLAKDCKKRNANVHQMVAMAFIGTCPIGKQIDHIDGNKLNNRADNLRYVTGLQNIRAGIALGLHQPRKLSRTDIPEIRRLSLKGMSNGAIGKQFKVHRGHIRRILRGECYKFA